MATLSKETCAMKLGFAIEAMAQRMVDTDRAISEGIWSTSVGPFTQSPEYVRLTHRRRWQRKAHQRLVLALTDLVLP